MNVSSKPGSTSANAKDGHIQRKPLSQDSSCDDLTDSSYMNPSSNEWDDNFAPEPSPTAAFNTENWSTSLQTVLDQPPSNLPRKLIMGGMVFCLAFAAWATLGQIEEVGHARGRLIPKGEVYKIHPVELGKVAKLAVKEGQEVKAGQVLVELDTEIAAGEVERLQQMLAADKIQLSQMQAVMDRMRMQAQARAAIAEADSQAAVAAIAQAKAKAASARELLTQLRADAVANQARLERLKPQTAMAQKLLRQRHADAAASTDRLARLEPLVKYGAIAREQVFEAEQALRDRQRAITQSQLEEGTSTRERLFEAQQTVRDRQRAITETQGELKQALVEINRLQAELIQKQAEGRTTQLEVQERIGQLEVEMTQLEAKIAENKNLLHTARAKLVQNFLYAPVDGFVSSLDIHNIGEVVQPGQTIAEMAPRNTPLVLSAVVMNSNGKVIK